MTLSPGIILTTAWPASSGRAEDSAVSDDEQLSTPTNKIALVITVSACRTCRSFVSWLFSLRWLGDFQETLMAVIQEETCYGLRRWYRSDKIELTAVR